jgi:hypothetical protein
MSHEWTPVFILPNLSLKNAIGCDIASLAPAHDPRIAALKRAYPLFKRFLNQFSDNFGQKIEPSVLLLNKAALPAFRSIPALAHFRDVIAVSAVTLGRSRRLRYSTGFGALFGETFSIYPWMLDRNYEHLVGDTPAICGIHDVSSFKGQSSASVFHICIDENEIDQPLLTKLIERWRRHYESAEPMWEDVALLRSLNMAYNASLMPSGMETTFYDVGRLIFLWVSAFEILIHPGRGGKANKNKVLKIIEETAWLLPESSQLKYKISENDQKYTLASWLYNMLNKQRIPLVSEELALSFY